MAQDMLETLRAIDRDVLTEVVRQDQRSPTFEILSWTVERFSDKGIANPHALFRFNGTGRDDQGTKSWSVVLKILKDPGTEVEPHHLRYWKRELLAMQSGLLASLPGPVAAPRCYGTSEQDGSGWIWMEHVRENINPVWTTDQYRFAAYQLGCFNDSSINQSPPDYPWLCKGHARTKAESLPPDHAWDSPFVRQAFSDETRKRVMALWNEQNRFYDALEQLPQVFSHFDFHRRNLLVRHQQDTSDQIVALDWAWCGYGALGADLYSVVGGSALIFELEATEVAAVEALAFEGYLAGLRDSGWAGNPELVRLAYDISFAMLIGTVLPALAAYATTEDMDAFVVRQFGRSQAEIASGWAALCELALDRADEARTLMNRFL